MAQRRYNSSSRTSDPTIRSFDALVKAVEGYAPAYDKTLLSLAWEFAQEAHGTQKRLSGDVFVTHPLTVAHTLATWKLDEKAIIAGLLHDTIEDTHVTYEIIHNVFGEDIAFIVEGVTKVTQYRLGDNADRKFADNLRKIFLAMSRDLRVIFVKLADRLHNMQTIDALSPDAQKANAKETLAVYAPLAEQLGIGHIRSQLEELGFRYAYPKEYAKVRTLSKSYYTEAREAVNIMSARIGHELEMAGVDVDISGRAKGTYSLWKKLQRDEIDWDMDAIHDVVALRVIVSTKEECYIALGIIHGIYRPAPHPGISDYIAQPKPNGYQSIHTKVFGPSGIAEIQIRTREMHEHAEFGAAAHWSYAAAKSQANSDEKLQRIVAQTTENKISWVKKLMAWQDVVLGSDEYFDALTFDALEHRIFVFSPKGDVYDLHIEATPVDFAFHVHTRLPYFMTGAKVNDQMVPLNYVLKSGDVVEIIKSKKERELNRDWLLFVKSSVAKEQISRAVRKLVDDDQRAQ